MLYILYFEKKEIFILSRQKVDFITYTRSEPLTLQNFFADLLSLPDSMKIVRKR